MFDITYDSDYHVFIEPIAKKARGMRRLFTAESIDNVIDIQEASTSKSHGENHYSIIAEPTNNTQTVEQFKCLEQPIFSDFDSDDSIADPNYVLSDQEESAAELVEDRHNNSAIEQPSLEKRCTKGRSREIRKERKISRNTGKAYETETGKKIPARTFKSLENCRNKCCSKLSTNAQKTMFDKYWGMGDRNRRASFISGLISFSSPKASRKRRNTPEKQKNRQVTFTYHIPIDGEQVKLCKSCFLRVFDETPKFVWVLCKQKQQSPTNYSTPDKRGMLPPPNKITDEQLNAVQEHLASLPAYESHYCRKETSKNTCLHTSL